MCLISGMKSTAMARSTISRPPAVRTAGVPKAFAAGPATTAPRGARGEAGEQIIGGQAGQLGRRDFLLHGGGPADPEHLKTAAREKCGCCVLCHRERHGQREQEHGRGWYR